MTSTEEDIAWLKSTFHPVPKPVLPDDCVEYSLFVIDPSLDQNGALETRLQLSAVKKYANDLQKKWLEDYIWQRQPFNLEIIRDTGTTHGAKEKCHQGTTNETLGLTCLRGRTEYGDSIEDEWVIVWLLRELSRRFPNLWVKLSDTDGEFLLIEASGTLPTWLEPEVAENRVWINDGRLKIIKPARHTRSSKHTEEKLTFQEAREVILTDQKRIMHSVSMEEEAFYRLRNYPEQIKDNMHHAILRLPRKVVYLLLQKPDYVAPAIEAFYLRDPISLKPLRAKKNTQGLAFPPQDLVEVSIKFPRAGYAQLRSQEFPMLDAWKTKTPSPLDPDFLKAETGMSTLR